MSVYVRDYCASFLFVYVFPMCMYVCCEVCVRMFVCSVGVGVCMCTYFLCVCTCFSVYVRVLKKNNTIK